MIHISEVDAGDQDRDPMRTSAPAPTTPLISCWPG